MSTELLTPLVIVLFWVWAVLGHRRLARTSEAALYRRRAVAVSLALGPCLLLAVLANPATQFLPAAVCAPLAALACLVHGRLEPTRTGCWHHRRLLPLAASALLGTATFLAIAVARADTGALVYAALILHHHLATGSRLQARAYAEVDALRLKVIALAAQARLPIGLAVHPVTAVAEPATQAGQDSAGDKARVAG